MFENQQTTVAKRYGPRAGRPGRRAGPASERLFITMNASARIETEAEVGRGDHFSHDVSERLVTKYEETAAEPMAPSGGSGGIEQPLLTPRRTFTLTPLPRRRPSPDAAALRTGPTTTPFDQNVTSRGERTQHAQATPVPESMGAQDQLAALQLRAAMAEASARLVAAELAAAEAGDSTPRCSRTGGGPWSPHDGRTPSCNTRTGGEPLQA